MLRLDNIFKAYGGKTVLSGFSLDIEPGERFILLGRSGCGKTTLLRLIAGFDRPDRGRIFIGGEDVGSLPVERRPVGLIFQNYALFPHMTVYDNIAVGPRVRNVSESDIRQRIGDLLEITRLGELRAAYPGELSGGEAQRVALARAIINQPKILLLDEPLSALDPNLRQTLREELVDMQKALGITFLFVTHDQEEAMTLATRMGILEEGRLLQAGTPQELYDHPVSPFVAGFLGDVNRLSAGVEKVEGRRVLVSLGAAGRLECEHRGEPALGQNALCFIRPEKMSFVDTNRTGPNALRGTITEKAFYGNHTQYHVKLDDGQTVTVPLLHGPNGKENSVAYETGARVCLRVPPASVLLFDTEEGSRDHPTD